MTDIETGIENLKHVVDELVDRISEIEERIDNIDSRTRSEADRAVDYAKSCIKNRIDDIHDEVEIMKDEYGVDVGLRTNESGGNLVVMMFNCVSGEKVNEVTISKEKRDYQTEQANKILNGIEFRLEEDMGESAEELFGPDGLSQTFVHECGDIWSNYLRIRCIHLALDTVNESEDDSFPVDDVLTVESEEEEDEEEDEEDEDEDEDLGNDDQDDEEEEEQEES